MAALTVEQILVDVGQIVHDNTDPELLAPHLIGYITGARHALHTEEQTPAKPAKRPANK